jgi:hypothetical protein
MNKFSNTNVVGSSISSIHFINEMATSLMLTASSELIHLVGQAELTCSGWSGENMARLRPTRQNGPG